MLKVAYFFICLCEGAQRLRQSLGIMVEVYAAYFTHGDRHANARDDTEIQLSLQGSIATAANSREGVGLRSMFC